MAAPDVDYIIKSELKTVLAAAIPDWPIRWANELWPAGIRTSTTAGNLPVDVNGDPLPCIQAAIFMGADTACPGAEDNRLATQQGLFKVFFIFPRGWGDEPLLLKIGALRRAFKRKTIQLDPAQWQRLTVMDMRPASGNEAESEDGARYVVTKTLPFWFEYRG